MAIFKCKICGGTLEIDRKQSVAICEYCGTKQTLPKLDDERRANLYDRANHFRRNNDFDKAMGIYENILNEDTTDAEAYWSIVLCRYGIEYVEDPTTHKRVPTVNRAQYTSIFDDEDYKSALQYADAYQREIYEAEANAINEIQKGILAISQKEEPFDVFICYKEADTNGRRTQDSVLATELYQELTREGFKVFFSRITLEDKLGQEYEPYIFAALNSAKVMVVLGTRPEHFNAVWVKNEWSRYLALIKNGERKTLIPAYRDMDPYDLPEEFSHLQALDMSKLGFMQDLTMGIKKIVGAETQKAAIKETIVPAAATTNTTPLLKRAFMFLEDGEWDKADDFCEQVLNQDPENAQAYLGKLLAERKTKYCKELFGNKGIQGIIDSINNLKYNNNYKKVVQFGNNNLIAELYEPLYQKAINALNDANNEEECIQVSEIFDFIINYKDSADKKESCFEKANSIIYSSATQAMNEATTPDDFINAANLFDLVIDNYADAAEKKETCYEKVYSIATEAMNNASAMKNKSIKKINGYTDAAKIYSLLTNAKYKKAEELSKKCNELASFSKKQRGHIAIILLLVMTFTIILGVILYIRLVPFDKVIDDGIIYEKKNGSYIVTGYTVEIKEEVIIPAKLRGIIVSSIKYAAFFGCTNITNIKIPDSVTKIGSNAFFDCNNLTIISIPASVTKIGEGMFCDCSSLTYLEIPDGVKSIEESAFFRCTNLTNIDIPDSVTRIENTAFCLCTNLKNINYNGTKAQWNAIVKAESWNDSTGSYIINCTDGTISK